MIIMNHCKELKSYCYSSLVAIDIWWVQNPKIHDDRTEDKVMESLQKYIFIGWQMTKPVLLGIISVYYSWSSLTQHYSEDRNNIIFNVNDWLITNEKEYIPDFKWTFLLFALLKSCFEMYSETSVEYSLILYLNRYNWTISE